MQEYESHSYKILHRQITRRIYISTSNNLTRTFISNKKGYSEFRENPRARIHFSSSTSIGAKSAKDMLNGRHDRSCTGAARIWLSVELWICLIQANFYVPRGISTLSITRSPTCGCFSLKGRFCLTSHLWCSRWESRYTSLNLHQNRSRCWMPFNHLWSSTVPDPFFRSKGRGSARARDT